MRLGNADLFDDCPICRAQRRANREGRMLSVQEYLAAAKEAEAMGATTGWF